MPSRGLTAVIASWQQTEVVHHSSSIARLANILPSALWIYDLRDQHIVRRPIRISRAESFAVIVQSSRGSVHDAQIPSLWAEMHLSAYCYILYVCSVKYLGPSSSESDIDLLMFISELYPIHIISSISEPGGRYLS